MLDLLAYPYQSETAPDDRAISIVKPLPKLIFGKGFH
jgi:hypothetical protein